MLLAKFQFHKGSIRTLSQLVMLPLLWCFNSIKVQLELGIVSFVASRAYSSFNSIKVQLEQIPAFFAFAVVLRCFNSIKVQLEQHIQSAFVESFTVSIP